MSRKHWALIALLMAFGARADQRDRGYLPPSRAFQAIQLGDTALEQRWARGLTRVEAHDPSQIASAFRNVVQLFESFGVRYRMTSTSRSGMTAPWRKLPGPATTLGAGHANCQASSVLVAASLQRQGLQSVLVFTPEHVVAAVLSSHPTALDVEGVPLSIDGTPRFLYPLEADFQTRDRYDAHQAHLAGRRFVESALRAHGTAVVDPTGRVLWRSFGDRDNHTAALGGTQHNWGAEWSQGTGWGWSLSGSSEPFFADVAPPRSTSTPK